MAQRRARAPWYVGSRTAIPVETWEFDTIAECTTVGVPISTSTVYAGMQIDWGDDTITAVTSDMTVAEAYTHEYAEAGQYHITVSYSDWENVALSVDASNQGYAATPIQEARYNIAKIYKIPRVASFGSSSSSNKWVFHVAFYYYRVQEVAEDLFANYTDARGFSSCFRMCTRLQAIPKGLFANVPDVISFDATFWGCTGLTEIPAGLFDNCSNVTSFYGTFYDCDYIERIPDGLFDNCPSVTRFRAIFCHTSEQAGSLYVPSDLFSKQTAVTDFSGTFCNAGLLPNMQCEDGTQYFALDIGSTDVTSFYFEGTTQQHYFWTKSYANVDAVYITLPKGSTTEVTALEYNATYSANPLTLDTTPCPEDETWEFDTIENCTTAGVPISTTTLYDGMTIDWGDGTTTTVTSDMTVSEAYTHTYETAGQYHIVAAYSDWTQVELSNAYSNQSPSPIAEARASISKVYQIPQVSNTVFTRLFCVYTNLTEIEDGLFDHNPQITDFVATFYGCSSLTEIPEGLFDNCPLVTDFGSTFSGCSSLTAIPSGLFDNCLLVTNFESTFQSCAGLLAIPDGLLDNNVNVLYTHFMFAYCYALTYIPEALLQNNINIEFFSTMFYGASPDDNAKCADGTGYFHLIIGTPKVTDWGIDNWCIIGRSCYFTVPENSDTYDSFAYYVDYECRNRGYALNTTPCQPTWEFDTIDDCTVAGVPISTDTAYTGMIINWGDGTITTVESVDDYVHTYEEAGQYHIVVQYDDWANVTLSVSSDDSTTPSPIAEARASIAKVYEMPQVANTSFTDLFRRYQQLTEVDADLFVNNSQVTNCLRLFYACVKLTSLPEGIFDAFTAVTTFQGAFNGASQLASVPEQLFINNTAVVNFSYTFTNCTSLSGASIYIGSTSVNNAGYFANGTDGTNTVYCPSGSTTYTTFNNASTANVQVESY